MDLFGGGSSRSASPQTPPPTPSRDDAAESARLEAERQGLFRRNAIGQQDTILTTGYGDTSQANISRKKLLGD